MMKVGVLTSSRADYGIYYPLLKKIEKDIFFDVEIIAFGTHLSKYHGYTVELIEKDFDLHIHKISSLITNDDEQSIATTYGLTIIKFADFWAINKFDIVLCLGDRFEMSAAVQAGIPYRINFVHLYGGDKTLGAIDEIYRHQITLASKIHFTAMLSHKLRVQNIIGSSQHIYEIGSISLEEIEDFKPIDKKVFLEKFNITDGSFALITFHPETICVELNHDYAYEIKKALEILSREINLVITMPNADTAGNVFRHVFEQLRRQFPDKVLLIENFGKINYFSAMYYSKLLIGNTSSGIVEAASFGKYVVNVGDRQRGREQSENVFDCAFNSKDIVTIVKKALTLGDYSGDNIYYRQGAVDFIITTLKQYEKL